MKIAFEISPLGSAHINPVYRTGVVRVIENLLDQLLNHRDCDMMLFSNLDHDALKYSIQYWSETANRSAIPFSKPPFYDLRRKLRSGTDELIHEVVTNSSLSLLKKLQLKFQIKQLQLRQRLYRQYDHDLYNAREVQQADIYHSSFFSLPGRESRPSRTRFFLTCYDLIPLLFPQYYDEGSTEAFNKILNSLDSNTWVLCISNSTRNDLLNHLGDKLNPERVIVTELAASDTFYHSTDKIKNRETRRKHHIPDGPYILSLCTFEPRKNIDQVIKGFAKLIAQENIRDLRLVLVGIKGWKYEKIFEEIESREDLKQRIVVTGFVADQDLAALYSDALFFVYPSFYEGFGLPPLEAMQCGVPVITSNTSSLPEVVGDAGIMVSPTDLDALCEAMLSLYKSPTLRQELSDKSKERAGLFSWERCGQETVHAYKASQPV